MSTNQVDGAMLKSFYAGEAEFKGRLIDCLTQGGFLVQSVRHTGEMHVVQIVTPAYLLNPISFMDWEKKQKKAKDGQPGEQASSESGKDSEGKA